MTARPPNILPQDVFVDHDVRPASRTVDTSHGPGAPTLAALEELNRRNAQANHVVQLHHDDQPRRVSMTARPPPPHGHIQFKSHTTSPSPPSLERTSEDLPALVDDDSAHFSSPLLGKGHNPLHVTTDIPRAPRKRTDSLNSNQVGRSSSRSGVNLQHKASSSSLKPVSRTPSVKQSFSTSFGSGTSSAYPSPVISAMGGVTPLPSPLLTSDSPGPWKRVGARRPSHEVVLPTAMANSVFITASGESVASALAHQSKRKAYVGLNLGHVSDQSTGKNEHSRNRSISEYIPDPKGIPKRQLTVSSGKVDGRNVDGSAEQRLRREPHLSEARGITPVTKPPTPPPSESSHSNDGSSLKEPRHECFQAHGRDDQKLRRWRAIKKLGEGTFSRVMLATSQVNTDEDDPKNSTESGPDSLPTPVSACQPDRKTLVAIKVCEHGPKGGASEDRIEMSLKRELDIMQSINHPSLVHLKAWNIEPTRALLVLSYCPGGDLFDVATAYRDSLTAPLLRRIFAELVAAVGYLHERRIVHRDIKLENVIVNIPPSEIANPNQDWLTYPYSIITLTDLGLSRRVADDEKLETRCGSDDYAAPEVILGQPYDGRAIDAWSLGVLLYALIESRLPFDAPPGASDAQRMRSRTSHRIARVEWSWIKYAGEDGDHDANEALFEEDGLKGAMEITEGLLKRARSRWPMEKVAGHEWVSGGIRVEGGIKFREEEEGEEVS
ncbi:Uu.00g050770.m01.CDS01 [Anthostomella pinea]|uniref:Uu.00g050770.m01.CDS01 n=1 Tax=Anthostomella pinea TaxID=933095 RepID=A0AAI8VTC7_9PEZI|nr:Uu.00g050770.m01.CDS01 [Anthostomella pinea]